MVGSHGHAGNTYHDRRPCAAFKKLDEMTENPPIGEGDPVLAVYRKLPGTVALAKRNDYHLSNYHHWLIAMGLYDTLNMLIGAKVHYGRYT